MRIPLLIAAVFSLVACQNKGETDPASGKPAPAEQKLVITGSSTVAPLVSEIGKRFEKSHPSARVDVQTGGSQRGVTDADQGLADIGMASRSQKPEDPSGLVFTPIANDGVTLIVHKDNPVAELTREQVVDIYTGKIASWKEVGGKDAPITVVNKAEGRSTLELFLSYYKLKNEDIKASVVIGDNQQGIKTISGNPDAIGYVSIGTAEYDATHGVPIKMLPQDGVEASIENVRLGRFGLSRPLSLVTKGEPTGLKKEFIDFARAEAQQDIVQEQYFVPLSGAAPEAPATTDAPTTP